MAACSQPGCPNRAKYEWTPPGGQPVLLCGIHLGRLKAEQNERPGLNTALDAIQEMTGSKGDWMTDASYLELQAWQEAHWPTCSGCRQFRNETAALINSGAINSPAAIRARGLRAIEICQDGLLVMEAQGRIQAGIA